MKPDLTPAKPLGFHSTGHLNLPHYAGLEGKRVSKELMGKKSVCYREDPCQHECSVEPTQAKSAPTARSIQAPTSLHFTGNPLVSRISDRNGGEMLHQLFCFKLSKTLASP